MSRFFLALLCCFLFACQQTGGSHLLKRKLFVFGTLVDVNVWSENDEKSRAAINQISRRLQQIHHNWHAWKAGRLQQINQQLRAGQAVQLSRRESALIRQSLELSKKSHGNFNPMIGEAISLWGFHTDEYPITTAPPNAQALNALAQQLPTVDEVQIEGAVIRSKNPHVWFDFGGLAKGWAVDEAIAILRNNGIENAVVNAGGDLRSIGNKGKEHWQVAIQSPTDRSFLAVIQVQADEAIFTSGNYQRYKQFAGKRYAHIINPQNLQPVEQIVSATVIADNGLLADAAATALVVAGDNWLSVATDMGIQQAMVVDEKGGCFATAAMLHRLEKLSVACQKVTVK